MCRFDLIFSAKIYNRYYRREFICNWRCRVKLLYWLLLLLLLLWSSSSFFISRLKKIYIINSLVFKFFFLCFLVELSFSFYYYFFFFYYFLLSKSVVLSGYSQMSRCETEKKNKAEKIIDIFILLMPKWRTIVSNYVESMCVYLCGWHARCGQIAEFFSFIIIIIIFVLSFSFFVLSRIFFLFK